MSERLAHELLNFIDHRIAKEKSKDDSITKGYILALEQIREKILREEQIDCEEKEL